jgi:hypothetical protein
MLNPKKRRKATSKRQESNPCYQITPLPSQKKNEFQSPQRMPFVYITYDVRRPDATTVVTVGYGAAVVLVVPVFEELVQHFASRPLSRTSTTLRVLSVDC